MRKNIGIIFMFLGVLLTVSLNSQELSFIEEFVYVFQTYWPLFFSFLGIYFVSNPKKKR